jgi:hypothetical protein
MRDMKRIEEFQKAIVGVKFTPAQKKIVELILKGWTIEVVNKHHMSGGQMMWKKPNSDYLEHAGKVYKAFFNVFYQIKKQSGVELSTKGYIN